MIIRLLERTLQLYHNGSISTIQPNTVKKVSELNEAIRNFSDRFAAGKVVISYEAVNSLIKVLQSLITMVSDG